MQTQISSLKDLFMAESARLYSVETQLISALPQMAELAQNQQLKQAITSHLEETRQQKQRLEQLFSQAGGQVPQMVDKSMQTMLQEAQQTLSMIGSGEVRDAAIIGCAQKVEHVEIAAYGTAASLAKMLGLQEAQQLLHQTLQEEKGADAKLTQLAEAQVNQQAQRAAE